MANYHIHDYGPRPWPSRWLGWYLRYTVCEGPSHDDPSVLDCHVLTVAATMRGVRKAVTKREREHREGRGRPFFEYPSTEVRP